MPGGKNISGMNNMNNMNNLDFSSSDNKIAVNVTNSVNNSIFDMDVNNEENKDNLREKY
jgi:hypothetical protein